MWGTWSRPYESMPNPAVKAAFGAIRVEFLAAVKEVSRIIFFFMLLRRNWFVEDELFSCVSKAGFVGICFMENHYTIEKDSGS